MKYLFYFYSFFYQDLFGGLLDKAISLSTDNENEVLFLYCGCSSSMCHVNPKGSKPMCKICSKITKKVLNEYGIKSKSLNDITIHNSFTFSYNNIKDLRNIEYKGAHIGLSIVSTYITKTRNSNPKIDESSRRYFDQHIKQCASSVDRFIAVIDEYKPDAIYTFNGRHEDSRALFDIATSRNIECVLSEVVFQNEKTNRVFFKNHLVHDILYNKERRDFCWDNYKMTDDEKRALGNSFFTKRRQGKPSGDKRIYILNQDESNVPPIDKSKINIGIFNSSEDEFSGIGGQWDDLKLFETQLEGINFLIEHAPNNVHFYLRIHPNLKDVRYRYHTDLLKIKKENITIIPGDSTVSTYSLMEEMNIIICFGSTMGIESTYWGKPAILLGPSFYYFDDLCYVPQTRIELLELLTKDLKCKKNDEILKIGAYTLDKSPLFIESEYIDYNPKKRIFLGRKYFNCPFMKFIINEKITAFVIAMIRFAVDNKLFYKYSLPLIEEE